MMPMKEYTELLGIEDELNFEDGMRYGVHDDDF